MSETVHPPYEISEREAAIRKAIAELEHKSMLYALGDVDLTSLAAARTALLHLIEGEAYGS